MIFFISAVNPASETLSHVKIGLRSIHHLVTRGVDDRMARRRSELSSIPTLCES